MMQNKSIFLNVFGESNKSRVLDFLIENCQTTYYPEDISETLSIPEKEVQEILDLLFDYEIVSHNAVKQYSLHNSASSHQLKAIDGVLSKIHAYKFEKKELM